MSYQSPDQSRFSGLLKPVTAGLAAALLAQSTSSGPPASPLVNASFPPRDPANSLRVDATPCAQQQVQQIRIEQNGSVIIVNIYGGGGNVDVQKTIERANEIKKSALERAHAAIERAQRLNPHRTMPPQFERETAPSPTPRKVKVEPSAAVVYQLRTPSGEERTITIPGPRIDAEREYGGRRGGFGYDDRAQTRFVTPDCPTVREIASTLTEGLSDARQKVGRILHFVRSTVKYDANEPNGSDYFRFPLETLTDKKGDCEDSAILFASLCKAAGLDVAMVRYPTHMAAAVVMGNSSGRGYEVDGKLYTFVETTGIGPNSINYSDDADSKTGHPIGYVENASVGAVVMVIQ